MSDKITIGSIVNVSFNNAQYTLYSRAEVLYVPCFTGDSWIFKCCLNGMISYVSEPCTIILLESNPELLTGETP